MSMLPPQERRAAGALEQENVPLFNAGAADASPVHDGTPPGWAAYCRRPAAAFWSSGVACALGSSLCFACAAAVVKTVKGINPAIPVFEIVVVRALVSGAVTSLSCRAGGLPIFGKTAPQWLLIARGVIGGSAMTLSYVSGGLVGGGRVCRLAYYPVFSCNRHIATSSACCRLPQEALVRLPIADSTGGHQ